jgi:hypothetical protein
MDQPTKKSRNDWPDRKLPDEPRDARFVRMTALEQILVDKVGLKKAEASTALTNVYPITKEKAAKLLRSELQKLRDAQKNGRHPSRRRTTLSLLEISDAAFTMVEAAGCLGDELLSLLEELLNLDRHRRSLAANLEALDHAAQLGAQVTLQGKVLGVRELARQLSIGVSTASEWMKSTEYKEKVALYKKCATDELGDYVEIIRIKFPEITDGHAFSLASAVHTLVLPANRFSQDLNLVKAMGQVFERIRLLFKQPPLQIDFLPAEKFSDMSREEMDCQRTMVLNEITKLIGDPAGKVDRLSGVFGKFLSAEH